MPFSSGDITNDNKDYDKDPNRKDWHVSTLGFSLKHYDPKTGQITTVKQGNTDNSKPPPCGGNDLKHCPPPPPQ